MVAMHGNLYPVPSSKEEEHGDLMFAYLTYVQLPWYVLMEGTSLNN